MVEVLEALAPKPTLSKARRQLAASGSVGAIPTSAAALATSRITAASTAFPPAASSSAADIELGDKLEGMVGLSERSRRLAHRAARPPSSPASRSNTEARVSTSCSSGGILTATVVRQLREPADIGDDERGDRAKARG